MEERLFLYEEPEERSEEEKRLKPKIALMPFSLADEWYAVDMENVIEVLRVPIITRVPPVPNFILGVMNVRGTITSITDLKRFFDLDETPVTIESRIIIVRAAKKTTGLLVDSVEKAVSLPLESLQPTLSTIPQIDAEYIRGELKLEDGGLLAILNLEKLMSSPKMQFEWTRTPT